MSRNPGIGAKWLEEFYEDPYNTGYCVHEKRKLKIPPYYDKWLEKNHPELFEKIKMLREEFIHEDLTYNDFYQKMSVEKAKFNSVNENKNNSYPDLDNNVLDFYKHLRRMEK